MYCLLYCYFCDVSIAQQPAYFILGEQQFRGMQIYDVVQDKEHNYYFATNHGVFRYNFYGYNRMACETSKSASVFNFVKDNKGIIYCHNLNNQVFQIKNGVYKLFYELDKEDAHSDISLAVSSQNELIIGARKLIVTDSNGKVLARCDKQGQYLGQPFTGQDHEILYHIRASDTILQYESGKFSKFRLSGSTEHLFNSAVLKFFRLGNQVYALDVRNKRSYQYRPDKHMLLSIDFNLAFSRSASVRIYETKNKIWITGTLPGAMLLDSGLTSAGNDTLYKNIFISDAYEDHEGNILLSTFDKGVLVIQDLNIPDVISAFRDNPATALYNDAQLGLLLGTSQGSVLSHKNKSLKLLSNTGERPIEGIYGHVASDFILFDNGYIRAYNKKTDKIQNVTEASLKDISFISPNSFFLGTNIGVLKCIVSGDRFFSEKVAGLIQRVYSLEYDVKNSLLFVATSVGLMCRDSGGLIRNIRYLGEEIFATDLFIVNGVVYAATSRYGILVIKNGKVMQAIKPKISGKTESLEKILFYKNSMIGKTSDGLYMFDKQGRVIKSLHSVFGFSDHGIIDFVLQNNTLWVSHSGGVQKLDLSYSQPAIEVPKLLLKSVYVNDEITAPNDEPRFRSDERKIEFELSVPTLRHRENLRYQYRLTGYNGNWNNAVYNNNHIVYNALAPGSYTLQVKAYINGFFTNEVVYPFAIASPFYLRGWFIFSMAFLFMLVVYLIYRWKLNTQQTKSRQINELNASKLTAIQSQMNPHFIFNALNSIQDLILKGNVEQSYSYITTFSNMVRRTLDYSDKDFIDFEQEIKLLELYLSLEKLRFKKDFEYTINVTNVEDVMLPPLLIQPFIENALAHGLLHKEGLKQLRITFELQKYLICTIEDNGIGREKSRTIQKRQHADHQSFSGKAIKHRFEILSEIFKDKFGYYYEDINDRDEPAGTKVTLRIPVKRKY